MESTTLIIILFVIIVFLTPILRKFLQNKKQYYFSYLLEKQEYERLEKELDAFSSKALFPRYTLECIRLQMYLMQNKPSKIDAQYDVVIESAVGKKQKKEILSNAFEHYVFLSQKKKSTELLHQIQEIEDASLLARCQMLYEIFIEKKADYIQQLEEKFDSLSGTEKMVSAYLLSVQYSNIQNHEKAEYYGNMSKNFFEK